MAQGAYGLSTKPLVGLALMQSVVQGILIQMLTTFLTTKSEYQRWFKIYIISVNILAMGQTIIHIIQAFNVIDTIGTSSALVAIAPVLTGIIGTTVQAFFMHRCWRIYRQRILAILPLIFLSLVSLVSPILTGVFLAQSLGHAPDNVSPQLAASTVVWVISSLLFDLVTTSSTIIYLCRARIGSNGRHSVLNVVWNVIWASAAPPLVLMVVTLVDHYVIVNSSGVVGVLAIGMSAKFFVLSLMINLVGQEYIRRQFERPYPFPGVSPNQTNGINEQGTETVAAHTVDVELMPRALPGVIAANDYSSGNDHFDNNSIKCPSIIVKQDLEGNISHILHNIQLDPK